MTSRGSFQIDCVDCKQPVEFLVSELDQDNPLICCAECGKHYGFSEELLKRQLKKFASLCKQIRDSEEILGNAGIAVDVGPHTVKIPYKILLTRLKSTLELKIGENRFVVVFRTEPTKHM